MSVLWNLKYGNPGPVNRPNPSWQLRNLRTLKLPYPMRLAWDTSQTITTCRVHYKALPYLEAALADIYAHARLQIKSERGYNLSSAQYDELTLQRLGDLGLDLFGGTWAHRAVRGAKNLSAHAYGIAIDLDPKHNALGTDGRIEKKSPWVIEIFRRRGFAWGGKWKRKDPMHFELSA